MMVAAVNNDRTTGACGFTLGRKRMKGRGEREGGGVVTETEKQLQV